MRRAFALFAIVALLALGAVAADRGFTIEQVLSAPFPSALKAAEEGTNRIAWTFDARGQRNIWVAEAPDFKARQVTFFTADDGQEILEIEWCPRSRTIVFVRGQPKQQSGVNPNPTSDPIGAEQAIWAVSADGGAPRRLAIGASVAVSPAGGRVAFLHEGEVWIAEVSGAVPPSRFFQARGTLSGLAWSPDGARLAFASNRGDHAFIGVYDPRSTSVRYLAPSVDRDSEPAWSPDGAQIAFVRVNSQAPGSAGGASFSDQGDRDTPWAIWAADVASGQGREIWKAPAREGGSMARLSGRSLQAWAADNRLVFTAELDGWNRLYSVAASGRDARGPSPGGYPSGGGTPALRAGETPALRAGETPALQSSAEASALSAANCEVEYLDFAPDKRFVYFASNCAGIDTRHLFRVSVSEGPAVQITSGAGAENYPAVFADGRSVAYLGADARRPLSVFITDARPSSTAARPRAVAAETISSDFPASQLVEPKVVTFKAADGLEIHGQLFEPQGSGKHPAMIFVHGGPARQMLPVWHYLYYYHNAYGFNQYLASKGYVVLSVNYRAGIGYGRAFRNAPKRGRSGAAEYQDVVAGAQFLRARSNVDAERIGMWGGSYGGYLTALGLARNSDLFAAGVDLHGVHDWSSMQQGGGAPQARQGAAGRGSGGARAAGGPGGQEGERTNVAFDSSPVSAVKTWRSPVLLIHGDDDRNVNFGQTVDLAARLREQKVTFEQLIFPDEVHDFLRHDHWLEAYHAAERFLEKYLSKK